MEVACNDVIEVRIRLGLLSNQYTRLVSFKWMDCQSQNFVPGIYSRGERHMPNFILIEHTYPYDMIMNDIS